MYTDDPLKILHIWNTAEVGGLLSRYMDMLYNTESKCFMYYDRDKFKFANEKVILYEGAKVSFHVSCILEARKHDILHFHAMDRYIPRYRMLFKDKKIIMHYHGSNIRGKWWERDHYWKYADHVLVSTPDLLENAPQHAIYLPNPVNEELCSLNSMRKKLKNTALHIDRFASDIAKLYADNNGLELEIFNRDKTPMIHKDFIKYLSVHDYYIDVKRDTPTKSYVLPAMSKTGLEALMCKCNVITWRGNILDKFPDQHRAFNICKKLIEIYQGERRVNKI